MFPFYSCCISSRPEVLICKKGVLKNFAKFTGKHLCQSFFLNKKETLTQVLSCEFCEIFKNNFFIEHLRWLLLLLKTFDKILRKATILDPSSVRIFKLKKGLLYMCVYVFCSEFCKILQNSFSANYLWVTILPLLLNFEIGFIIFVIAVI